MIWVLLATFFALTIPLTLAYYSNLTNQQTIINNFQNRSLILRDTLRTLLSVRPATNTGFCRTQIPQFSSAVFASAPSMTTPTELATPVTISIDQLINNAGSVFFSNSVAFQDFILTNMNINRIQIVIDKRIYLASLNYSVQSSVAVQGIKDSSRTIPLILYTQDVGGGNVQITDCQTSMFEDLSQVKAQVASSCSTLGAAMNVSGSSCSFLLANMGKLCPTGSALEGFNTDGTPKCKSL